MTDFESSYQPSGFRRPGPDFKRRRRDLGEYRVLAVDDDDPAVVELDQWIIGVGEKTPTQVNRDIEELATAIIREFDKQPSRILKRFCECITEIPFKPFVYAGLWSVINNQNPSIGSSFTEAVEKTVSDEKLNRLQYRCLLRFLAAAARLRVISQNSFFAVLDTIPDTSWDLVCTCVPLLSSELWNSRLQSLSGSEYLMITSPLLNEHFRTVFEARSSQNTRTESVLKTDVDKLAATNPIPRDIRITSPAPCVLEPPYPELDVSVYRGRMPQQYVEATGRDLLLHMPADDIPERAFVEDLIRDTIEMFEVNPKECAKFLLASFRASYAWFQPKITRANHQSTHPASDPDVIDLDDTQNGTDVPVKEDEDIKMDKKEEDLEPRPLDSEQISFNLEQLLVESIFSQLLRLPDPPAAPVYYHVLSIHCCRMAPNTFPIALGRAISILFANMNDMDHELLDRVADWFSHHLSNFEYFWMWNEWEYILEDEENRCGQVYFIRAALEKMVRLSYWDRINDVLPVDFQKFLPPKPAPVKFPKHECEGDPFVLELMTMIRRRRPFTEVLDALKSKPEGLDVGDVIARCILEIGSKSFSHLLSAMERYLPVLQTVDMNFLEQASDFWENNRQFFVILVDKALNYRVVKPPRVKEWLLDNLKANLFRGFTKDILYLVLERLEGDEILSVLLQLTEWAQETTTQVGQWMQGLHREILRRWAHKIGTHMEELPQSDVVNQAKRLQIVIPNPNRSDG